MHVCAHTCVCTQSLVKNSLIVLKIITWLRRTRETDSISLATSGLQQTSGLKMAEQVNYCSNFPNPNVSQETLLQQCYFELLHVSVWRIECFREDLLVFHLRTSEFKIWDLNDNSFPCTLVGYFIFTMVNYGVLITIKVFHLIIFS